MKKFFQKIGGFFAKLVSDFARFLSFLADHVDDAIEVVGQIRAAVEGPVLMSLAMFLPEKLRNDVGEAREKVLSIIDSALAELLAGQVCLEKATTIEKLRCFIDHLKKLPPAQKEALYMKFASLYAKHSHGAKFSTSQYDYSVQARFVQDKYGIEV